MRPDQLERRLQERLDALGPGYVDAVDLAWRWLVGGVVAIGVGLTVWWTAFFLVPLGVVLLAIGTMKSVRSTLRARSK